MDATSKQLLLAVNDAAAVKDVDFMVDLVMTGAAEALYRTLATKKPRSLSLEEATFLEAYQYARTQ